VIASALVWFKFFASAPQADNFLARVHTNKQKSSNMFARWRSPKSMHASKTACRCSGNISLTNLQVLNAIGYIAEQGCKWRELPNRFGRWHRIYMRMNRWAKKGVLDRVFEQLQVEQIVCIRIEAFSIDSSSVKVHPDGTGALKKTDRRPSANPPAVAADARTAVAFTRFAGSRADHDAPHGRALLEELGPMPEGLPLLMDRARIALRTQRIIAYETGATNTTDSVG
jgi:transposase